MDSEKKVKEKVKEIIEEWLKDTSKILNINGLRLTEWPGCLKGKEHLIIELNCSYNQLTSLPNFPNLTYLRCSYNQLTSLPSLLRITRLYCDFNQLISLPDFPKLTKLYCDYNKLTSLPSPSGLPDLTKLNCERNQLFSLPSFSNLTVLCCSLNKLTSLPSLHKLTVLWCLQNQLKMLPSFPKLTLLFCEDTQGALSGTQLFSTKLDDWKKIWPLQTQIKTKLRNKGIKRVIKVLKNRLYLPRLNNLHQELIYSPNHQGKFYKTLRIGNWSFEKIAKKKLSKLSNLNK